MSQNMVMVSEERLIEEGEVAGDYLEQLLDILDYDGDIELDVDGDRASVAIAGGSDLDRLVGVDGDVLESLQELTRLSVQQQLGDRSRLMLDIAGWRANRREELRDRARLVAQRVLNTGEKESLDRMTPFERKVVHDVIAEIDGVKSDSEGDEPNRHVTVLLDTADSPTEDPSE